MVKHVVPRVPASAGALIRDDRGHVLLLKPTYKPGWTLPGGEVEDTGESPWQACRREVREECGLQVDRARLVCVDSRPPRKNRSGGVRFLFDCGVLDDVELARITVPPAEISQFRLAPVADALTLLRPPVSRRVAEVLAASGFVYLEDGHRVDGIK